MRLMVLVLATVCVPALSRTVSANNDGNALRGVWVAESMHKDGRPAPDEAVKRMRFTFDGDTLLVRGNAGDDRESKCSYKIDASHTPNHLDINPPDVKRPVLAIFEHNGDSLKICLRSGESDAGRPTEFATKDGSSLVLIVFKRQAF